MGGLDSGSAGTAWGSASGDRAMRAASAAAWNSYSAGKASALASGERATRSAAAAAAFDSGSADGLARPPVRRMLVVARKA